MCLTCYMYTVEVCKEDDGANSQCESSSGGNVVRDTLVIVSCVLSLLVLTEWSV